MEEWHSEKKCSECNVQAASHKYVSGFSSSLYTPINFPISLRPSFVFMIRTACFLVLVASFLSLGCSTTKQTPASNNRLPAVSLTPFGRTRIDAAQNLELITSA